MIIGALPSVRTLAAAQPSRAAAFRAAIPTAVRADVVRSAAAYVAAPPPSRNDIFRGAMTAAPAVGPVASSSPAPSSSGGGGIGPVDGDAAPPELPAVRADAPSSSGTDQRTVMLGAVAALLLVGGFLMMRKGMV